MNRHPVVQLYRVAGGGWASSRLTTGDSWSWAASSLFCRVRLHVCRLADFEHLLRVDGCEEMHQTGDDSSPAGLVACAKPGPVVTVEIFVEQQAIAPVRIVLELLGPPVDRPPPVLLPQHHPPHS